MQILFICYFYDSTYSQGVVAKSPEAFFLMEEDYTMMTQITTTSSSISNAKCLIHLRGSLCDTESLLISFGAFNPQKTCFNRLHRKNHTIPDPSAATL